jgi:glycosyltransferase involved in cell wall biosynthesis
MTVKDIQSVITVKDLPAPPAGKRGWPWTVGSRPLPLRRADGSEWPRLSVVTPSYNQGRFLEMTIRSVLLQGYPNLEYIVIDGGSSDESVAVIRKYEKFLSFWVSEKDNGQTDAVNKGLLKSSGEYLGWINSDDIYLKDAFQRIINLFLRSSEIVLAHGNHVLIDKDDRVIGSSSLPAFNPPIVSVPVFSETAFWTRSAMDVIGLLNPQFNFSMDLEFFTRLALYGPVLKTNNFLGCLRCHAESKTSTISIQGRQETDQLWRDLFDSEYTGHQTPRNYIRRQALIAAIFNPRTIGFPYLKTKLEDFIRY